MNCIIRIPLIFIISSSFIANLTFANVEEVFEVSVHLCEKCTCACPAKDNQTMAIDCTNRGMERVIADWPEHPKHLVASFSYNNISELQQLPETIAESVSVSYSYCGIQELSTALFVNCLNIKYVDLSYNLLGSEQLTGDVFKGKYNTQYYEPLYLKSLNLAYNRLHSLSRQLFEHIPFLESLNLEGNGFTLIDQSTTLALSKLTKLQVLNLANNKLTELPGDSVKYLESLLELDLSNNEFDIVPECITYLAGSLEVLKINDNPIIYFTDQSFIGLRSLRFLNASSLGHIKSIEENTFSELQSLRVLHLANNKHLAQIKEEAFGILRSDNNWQLQEVYFNDNVLKNIPTNLMPWFKLKIFNVDGNSFDCTCDLYNIATQLPNITKYGKDSTYCTNYNWVDDDYRIYNIYDLRKDVCNKTQNMTRMEKAMSYGSHNIKIMRVTTTTLAIILFFTVIIAITIGWYKFKSYKRSKQSIYPVIAYDRLNESTINNKF